MDKDKLQDLLLFYSSEDQKLVTLNEYVNRMKEDQKDIYFVSGSDVNLIDKLPIVQTLKKKDYEVLYLTDEVDEFVMQTLMTYREKTFRNAAQGDLDLDSEEEKQELEKAKEDNKELLEFMKESLHDQVAEVKLSNRLIDDPVCLTAGEGLSFEMEKVFANMPKDNPMMPMKATRILEINPDAVVNIHKTFYVPETADSFDFSQYDYVVDAIDTVTGKLMLVEQAKASGTPIISSMGAGNKMDPTGFMVTDIYKTSVCPLAKVMRRELKKRGIKKLKVVYSQEKPMTPIDDMAISCKSHCICLRKQKENVQRRQVPGSNAFVPSVVGLIIAGEVVKDLIK